MKKAKNSSNKNELRDSLVLITAPSNKLLSLLNDTISTLETFDVPYDISILAAHRSPKKIFQFMDTIEKRGIEVIIAGASGAAHLPGMIASLTSIPVVGIPFDSANFNGIDSVYSMLQMPKGVPVGVIGINSAHNAAIFACQILSIKHSFLKLKLNQYKQRLAEEVEIEDNNLKLNKRTANKN